MPEPEYPDPYPEDKVLFYAMGLVFVVLLGGFSLIVGIGALVGWLLGH